MRPRHGLEAVPGPARKERLVLPMPHKRIEQRVFEVSPDAARRVEQLLVLTLLEDEPEPRWSRGELGEVFAEIPPELVDAALEALQRDGVVCREDEAVWASAAARRIDAIGLIGV